MLCGFTKKFVKSFEQKGIESAFTTTKRIRKAVIAICIINVLVGGVTAYYDIL